MKLAGRYSTNSVENQARAFSGKSIEFMNDSSFIFGSFTDVYYVNDTSDGFYTYEEDHLFSENDKILTGKYLTKNDSIYLYYELPSDFFHSYIEISIDSTESPGRLDVDILLKEYNIYLNKWERVNVEINFVRKDLKPVYSKQIDDVEKFQFSIENNPEAEYILISNWKGLPMKFELRKILNKRIYFYSKNSVFYYHFGKPDVLKCSFSGSNLYVSFKGRKLKLYKQ